MSLQWSIVGLFLYLEIGFTVLLLVPFVSAQLWYKCLRPLFKTLMKVKRAKHYIQFAFFGLLLILTVACISSYNDASKYSAKLEGITGNPETEMRMRLKLFRAQRNFYITGFSLLLAGIIRRLLALISSELSTAPESAKQQDGSKEAELTRKLKSVQSEKEQLLAESKRLQEKLSQVKSKATD